MRNQLHAVEGSMGGLREDRAELNPERVAQADEVLRGTPEEVFKKTYKLVCRLETAEGRASERERYLEQNERLKSKLFDLLHMGPDRRKMECCGGVVGVSTVTGEEVRFHEGACPLRNLTSTEVEQIGELCKLLENGDDDGVNDGHVNALFRAYGGNRQRQKKAKNEHPQS